MQIGACMIVPITGEGGGHVTRPPFCLFAKKATFLLRFATNSVEIKTKKSRAFKPFFSGNAQLRVT